MADTGDLPAVLEAIVAHHAAGVTRVVRIHYRHAVLEGASEKSPTLQERLSSAMKTDLAGDVSKRLLKVTATDEGPQGCLNSHQSTELAFVGDIMHFDRRTVSLRFVHPDCPSPVAKIEASKIAENQSSLGEPIYFMVRGNHLAVIERPGFSLPQFTRYLNALLASAGKLDAATLWKLSPKMQFPNGTIINGPVKKVVLKPHGAMDGYGPTQAPEPKRRKRKAQAALDELLANGPRVFEILRAVGTSEAKIESLRSTMSSDLALRAKVELTVVSTKQKSTAELPADVMNAALADILADGEVEIVAADGKTCGKLTSLSHKTEVLEINGLLEWTRATEALAAVLSAWYAKGAIDIHENTSLP